MATSLLGLGLIVQAGAAVAQNYVVPPAPPQGPNIPLPFPAIPAPPAPQQQPAKTLQFHRDPIVIEAPQVPANAPAPLPAPAFQINVQPPDKMQPKAIPEEQDYLNLSILPGLEVISRVESEAQMMERWKQKALKTGERLIFPDEPALSKEPYAGRYWSPKVKAVEPSFVVHGRLYFEQLNLERGIWDLGVVTPLVSLGGFYWDLALLPYNCGTRPCQKYDTSAGKCLPGDPTPFFLYPPELSLTGLAAEGAVLASGFFIFP